MARRFKLAGSATRSTSVRLAFLRASAPPAIALAVLFGAISPVAQAHPTRRPQPTRHHHTHKGRKHSRAQATPSRRRRSSTGSPKDSGSPPAAPTAPTPAALPSAPITSPPLPPPSSPPVTSPPSASPQPPASEPPVPKPPAAEPPTTEPPTTKPPGSEQPGSELPGSEPPSSGSPPASADPFAGRSLYVEPDSPAATTAQQWAGEGRTSEAAQLDKIASQPVAQWFGDWSYGHGGTEGDVNWWVGAATAAGALPVLVAYDIPWRDCSQYSSGGAASAAAYEQFIDAMVAGIGARRAVVIVEPDALAELECLPEGEQTTYYSLLEYAVAHLSADPLVSVYLDAGNAGWQSASTMAARLRKAGVAKARGFSLNVSNFDTTASETAYGEAIVKGLGSAKQFVIDTSRNGRGPAAGSAWCNPPGRGLGAAPTAQTGNPLVDAYLWIKHPGESDGTCNGGPAAGQWWARYALELAANASP